MVFKNEISLKDAIQSTPSGDFIQADKGLNNINSYRALTDKKVRFSFEIPGQVVPKRNKIMKVIGFYIDECYIEIRNVPVVWKKIDEK